MIPRKPMDQVLYDYKWAIEAIDLAVEIFECIAMGVTQKGFENQVDKDLANEWLAKYCPERVVTTGYGAC